jgi:hypothetical protein
MTTDVKLDCYAVLGLAANADDAAVRAAFAELTRQYDPQHFPGGADEAQRKLSELETAYEVLSDPVRRRRHDFHRRISTLTAEFDAKDGAPHRAAAPAAANPVAATARPRRGLAWYALIAAVLVAIAFGLFQYSSRQTVTRSPDASAPAMINARPAAETKAPAPPAEAPTPAAPQVPATVPQDTRPATGKPGPAKSAPANPQGNAPAATAPEACTDVLTALGLCKPKPTPKDK